MKKKLVGKGQKILLSQNEGEGGGTKEELSAGTRSISRSNEGGMWTNLRVLRSLCGRLASMGSRRFRDT